MKLFHLSEVNHNNKVFKPRVPYSVLSNGWGSITEDVKTKRVCFSKTITGAYYAINFEGGYNTLYVHVPENLNEIIARNKIYKPTEKEVQDADYTDEIWVKCPVKMKCIGKIQIGYTLNYYEKRPKVHFKYLERY